MTLPILHSRSVRDTSAERTTELPTGRSGLVPASQRAAEEVLEEARRGWHTLCQRGNDFGDVDLHLSCCFHKRQYFSLGALLFVVCDSWSYPHSQTSRPIRRHCELAK